MNHKMMQEVLGQASEKAASCSPLILFINELSQQECV
jgi:hypothetical protein